MAKCIGLTLCSLRKKFVYDGHKGIDLTLIRQAYNVSSGKSLALRQPCTFTTVHFMAFSEIVRRNETAFKCVCFRRYTAFKDT